MKIRPKQSPHSVARARLVRGYRLQTGVRAGGVISNLYYSIPAKLRSY